MSSSGHEETLRTFPLKQKQHGVTGSRGHAESLKDARQTPCCGLQDFRRESTSTSPYIRGLAAPSASDASRRRGFKRVSRLALMTYAVTPESDAAVPRDQIRK
ncbi:hypothetical protein EYF80_028090 [Liparis tanakae]|uniref:Uncharacterized protein n=1 Tax=Liparis tanakae TaxID=230148 RepID=A0A4Z2H719_9TELE|nr:hypothetical protein EYF80_028090 [Liparis tanakae]